MDAEDHPEAHGPPAQPEVYRGEHSRVPVPDEVFQYAYEHDLIRDHTLDSFSIAHLLRTTVQSTLPSVTEDGFPDSSRLPDLEICELKLRSERMTITQSAQQLLYDTQRELTDDEVKSLTQDIMDPGNTKDLKLELPLLRTDNKYDMRKYRREMAARREVCVADHGFPLDPVAEEDGDGMQLSESARSEAEELQRRLENEKLGITRSALRFLAGVIKDNYDEAEHWNSIVERTKWVRVSKHPIIVLKSPSSRHIHYYFIGGIAKYFVLNCVFG
jgi:hypothetical protein